MNAYGESTFWLLAEASFLGNSQGCCGEDMTLFPFNGVPRYRRQWMEMSIPVNDEISSRIQRSSLSAELHEVFFTKQTLYPWHLQRQVFSFPRRRNRRCSSHSTRVMGIPFHRVTFSHPVHSKYFSPLCFQYNSTRTRSAVDLTAANSLQFSRVPRTPNKSFLALRP